MKSFLKLFLILCGICCLFASLSACSDPSTETPNNGIESDEDWSNNY